MTAAVGPDLRSLLAASWRHRRPLPERRTAGAPRRPHSLARDIHRQLLDELDRSGGAALDTARLGDRVTELVDRRLDGSGMPVSPRSRRRLIQQVVAELTGAGPLEALLADPAVSDVLVNRPDEVWVDRLGRLERTGVRFDDEEHLRRVLDRLVASHGRHLDEATPHADVRLADGTRLHALLPPLVEHPVVSLRRPRPAPFRLSQLVAIETLSAAAADRLVTDVRAQRSVLISGGAGSGKTTLLNVLADHIPPHERVITVEETAELRLAHRHVVRLEARPPNVEGRGEITLRTLVRNALRMRADRILVGEVRGPEVFDMLQAMNVGHRGSLTTVHANGPDDALRRLEGLVLLAGLDLTPLAIRELIAHTIERVVHIERRDDGRRRVTAVCEVTYRNGELSTRDLLAPES